MVAIGEAIRSGWARRRRATTSAPMLYQRVAPATTVDAEIAWSDFFLGSRGTTAKTLGALTRSVAGTVLVQGSTSATLGALARSASGTVAVNGALSKTLGALVAAVAGTVGPARAVVGSVVVPAESRRSYVALDVRLVEVPIEALGEAAVDLVDELGEPLATEFGIALATAFPLRAFVLVPNDARAVDVPAELRRILA